MSGRDGLDDRYRDAADRARAAQQAVNDLGAGPIPAKSMDQYLNEVMAAGSLWANLTHVEHAEPVFDSIGQATNELYVRFAHLRSRYRVTLTIDPEPGDPR